MSIFQNSFLAGRTNFGGQSKPQPSMRGGMMGKDQYGDAVRQARMPVQPRNAYGYTPTQPASPGGDYSAYAMAPPREQQAPQQPYQQQPAQQPFWKQDVTQSPPPSTGPQRVGGGAYRVGDMFMDSKSYQQYQKDVAANQERLKASRSPEEIALSQSKREAADAQRAANAARLGAR